MLQNATPRRKSAPEPPNIFDEDVSCTAPATRHASLQIFFKCPTPAIVFENATKPSCFFPLLTRCTIPCACHAKRHPNVEKCSVPLSFLHFLTSKCASRHNGVHFFDISTSKSVPNVVCFCTFWLGNVLRATTACTFSTSQFLKATGRWAALYIFTWKCASRHNGVPFFISHLARWLRTHRFSEPTFPHFSTLRSHKSVEKHSVSRLSYLFRTPGSSFFWLFFDFLSSSSLTLPISAFHLSILSEIWLLNFLRLYIYIFFFSLSLSLYIYIY